MYWAAKLRRRNTEATEWWNHDLPAFLVVVPRASSSIRNRTQHERVQFEADGCAFDVAGGGVGDQVAVLLQLLRLRTVRFCGHCDDYAADCEPGNSSIA